MDQDWKPLNPEMQAETAAIIGEAKLNLADFQIDHTRNDFHAVDGTYTILMTVRVALKRTGKGKTYRAGHGTTWPAEFETDVISGVYGRP
jgi:hypothetical protein